MITFYKLPLSSLRSTTKYARKGGDGISSGAIPPPPDPPPYIPPPPPPPGPPDYGAQNQALWEVNQRAAADIVVLTEFLGNSANPGQVAAFNYGQRESVPYQLKQIDEQLAILASAPSDALNFPQGGERVAVALQLQQTKTALESLQKIDANENLRTPPSPPPFIPPPPGPYVNTCPPGQHDWTGDGICRYSGVGPRPGDPDYENFYPPEPTVCRLEPAFVPQPPPPPIYVEPPPPPISVPPPPEPILPPPPIFRAPPPEPSATEILIDEIKRQRQILSVFNRVFARPIEPAQPEFIWPLGSWQYNLWSKGYTMREISATEEKIAITGLLNTNVADNFAFQLKTESIAGEIAINFANSGVNTRSEVMPVTGVPFEPQKETDSFILTRTADTIPGGIFQNNPVASDCQFNDWCNVLGTTTKPQLPQLTVDVTDPRRRVRVRRLAKTDSRIPSIGAAAVNTVQLRKQMLVQTQDSRPKLVSTPSRRFCGTGNSGTNWEGSLMGQGATVAEMDTVRRLMSAAAIAPGTTDAGKAGIAASYLDIIRSRTGEGTRSAAQDQNLQNEVTQNSGVVRSSLSTTAMDRAILIARRATQRQKRSSIR